MATVRAWAGSLDRDRYIFTRTDQGILIEQVVDEDVIARLASTNVDLVRGNEATRILFCYHERYNHISKSPAGAPDDLGRRSRCRPRPCQQPPDGHGQWPVRRTRGRGRRGARSTVRRRQTLNQEDLVWAAGLLIKLPIGLADYGASEDDSSVFGQGPDRAGARALPLLVLPAARDLRDLLIEQGVTADAIARAVAWVVDHGANETRLFLTRGYDPLWRTSCDSGTSECHHAAALRVIEDTARNIIIIGPWDQSQQRNSRLHINGPVAPRLQHAGPDRVDVRHLSATIRGAETSQSCRCWCCCWQSRRTVKRAKELAPQPGVGDATGATRDSISSEPLIRAGDGPEQVSGPETEYAGFIEFGTSKMPPRPFMNPAADYVLPKLEADILKATFGRLPV